MLVYLRPQPAHEARHAVHAGLVPLQRLLRRCSEHREQPHRISAVLGHHRLRVHAVVLGLGHLLGAADLHRLAVCDQHRTGDAATLVALDLDVGRVDPVLAAIVGIAIEGVGDDHALGEQIGHRLVAVHQPRIAHELVIEAEVHQVQDRVLDAAHIQVGRHPVIGAEVDHVARLRAGVARHIPARFHEGVEGIGFALGRAAAVRAGGLAPGRIGLDRRTGSGEFHVLRQYHRQLVFRYRHCAALGAIDHRNRAAPVTLAAHAPVAQAVIDPALALALALEALGQCFEGAAEIQAIELGRIDQLQLAALVGVPIAPVGGIPGLLFFVARLAQLDHLHDRQAVLVGEFEIALVVAGNGHHRAGAVAHQHEVGHPHRHLLAADRVDRGQAGGHAAFFLGFQLGF